jgi:membrane-associated phospholipid phosphatase
MRCSAPTPPPFATRARAAIAALLFAAALPAHADDRFEKFGDAMQIALPFVALTCAAKQGRAAETALGFAVQAAAVNGSKAMLRDARINQRPDGKGRGFPSGHSASAMFGAANLAEFCYQGRPALQFASYSLALAVGLSRMDANRHTPLQVAAGLALGYFANGLRLSLSKHGMSLSFTWRF